MKKRGILRICAAIFCFFLISGTTVKEVHAANDVTVEDVLLQEVNAYRASYGLQPLYLEYNLTAAAQVRAGEITYYFSHTRPDGTPWYTVDYYRDYGETLASGYDCTVEGAQAIVSLWMSSKAHAQLLLYRDFRSVGFAVRQGSDGAWYWTAELGF